MAQGRPAVLARLYSPAGRALSAFVAFSLLFTSGGGLWSRLARASELPRVLVLPYAPVFDGLPGATGEKVAAFLSEELRASEQLQLVALKPEKLAPPKAASPAVARDAAALTEARERAAKADEFAKKLKFRQAADEYEKVLALLEGQHPYIDFADLVDAHLNVAVAYFRLGLDSDGEGALAQVVRLDPERKLDAERYPPVFIRAYDNISKKVKKAPRASIEVKAAPGATVLLDGREVGKTPLLIKDVIKGVHFVRVLAPGGGAPWSSRVDAPSGDAVRVIPDLGGAGGPLTDLLAQLSRNVLDEAVLARTLALAEGTADFVVLGGVHREGDGLIVSSHLLKVSTKKVCLLQRVVFDAEMNGAGIEIYKVATDLANKIEVFGEEEKLPAKVARDALAKGAAPVATVSAGGEPAQSDRVVKPSDAPVEVKTEVRKVQATEGEPGMVALEPDEPAEDPAKASSSSKAWIWVVVAVVVAGGIGAGTYFYVDASTKPITGKGTISW